MLSRYFGLIAALAVAVTAQTGTTDAACSAPTGGILTIQAQGDTAPLAGCEIYTGNIVISKNAAGAIELPGVQQLTGEILVDGAENLTSLTGDSLKAIGGSFTLNNLVGLKALSFPFLTACGDVTFKGLPNLNKLGFNKMLSQVGNLDIENTFLSDLSGLNVSSVTSIYIANNRMLNSATFLVNTVPKSIVIEANGASFEAAFPNLQSAQNLTFRGAAAIDIPSLVNVTGSLGFYENPLDTISAPNLTLIGQTLAVNANPALTNVSFPLLTALGGGFQIQNNTQLTEVTFPSLTTIGGAIDFFGGFTTVSLPGLKDCRGGFNIQSSSTSFNCSAFDGEHGPNKVIKGTYKCAGAVSNPGNINSNPKSGSGGGSKSDAIAVGAPRNGMLLSLAGLLAGVMFTL